MAWAAALYLVSASSSSSLRPSSCWIAASWLRCSIRIVRCCLGICPQSLLVRLDDEHPLEGQIAPACTLGRGRCAVDVDVVSGDRSACVLSDEPATVAVVAVGGDIDPAS